MTRPARPDAILRVPGHVMARRIGADCVMLDLERGAYFGLDAVGARVWELLQEGRTFEETCAAIADEYDAPRARIERDLSELLEELAAAGLVSRE